MRYLTELICDLYRLTDHHKLTTATFKNLADIKLVGVRLENGNFPTLSVLSLTSDFVPLSANP